MAPPLLQLSGIALTFGGTPLLEGADLAVSAGERIALVGRNGSGKSTLLRIAAGLVESDRGERFLQPGTTVRYLPQEPDLAGFASTLAFVEAGLGPADDRYRARYLLEQLGLSGNEEPTRLSGGEARRAAIARALAPDPDILLLDEPTNHLDLPAIEWLEAELLAARAALIMISHDRRFLQHLSRSTVWLDRGLTRRVEIGFGEFEAWRDERLAEEELERHKLDRKIVDEEHWLRYGVTARRKRNMRRLAALEGLKQSRRDYRKSAGTVSMQAAQAEKSGALVVEAKNIAKQFGERAIVRDFSTRIMRGDRVGVVGPNGSGKTTLVNLLTGSLAPDGGEIRLGANLQMATLDQRREQLDPDWTLADALTGGHGETVSVGHETRHVVGYMRDFLFAPEQARTPLRVLSGGERGRLMLARALARPSNLLVLDEPTNDLDLETLDVLEEMLGSYEGTVVLISHDRDFLDRIVNAVIVPEGDGRWLEYAGGYSDMLAQRGADLATRPAAKPKAAKAATSVTAPRAGAPGKRRLKFHEKHALETLPKQIAELKEKLGILQKRFDDPDLYARNPESFAKTSDEIVTTQAELASAEEKWLELEILREEIESS
ncbi:MAG TPA: ATP-binding cassette domain-containing protein [Xanthobacteraceae bacterium]|nr:ATP-binding cassette domain-containing protein [Xanthobacteraceae bacterium]